ncbi:MAG: type VI secretion system baseplate subunit TssE [Succinivibrio dextrinosolvens]|uniref:Gene 25-like lysozyme n=1 Tax=Succinivibrio dextrinosolvens TaxID=83771 RepID=A0A662Z8L5_9GAMM|nr:MULTISPECIES: type VI secretion system baseplate subunit TssE [Succinivibrio]MBQ9219815.1 type VI secretion system baseplate subunit TssE [Succinivibrio sp.]MDY6415681.1 type VI secretion system baseplate subunit TssE [Succinivibrio dextrinosolvens]MDY6421383.1 type VI secretion system baseplate subunit TssE [Succinivibrio dextrinosolvens]MDY6465139.1 type VI secretion system baseplate subunit TssE [Succinivibrio dextrinosolvens]MDY6470258.1 type VI secretion system baseplate subunit TssE [
MADSSKHGQQFYLPSLLSRLTKEDLDGLSDLDMLKEEILDNIFMLLNSRVRPEKKDLESDPFLYRSVLGYGLSDFCGLSHNPFTVDSLLKEIRDLIEFFEPRLDPASIKVQKLKSNELTSNIKIQITGRVSVPPYTDEVNFLFTLDLESGVPHIHRE